MTRRHRLPARPLSSTADEVDLHEIVASLDGTWAEKALGDEVRRLGDIALNVADIAVSTVARVFERHGLLDDAFDTRDNDALYRLITEIAVRLVRERLIEGLSDGRRHPPVSKEIAVSVLLRDLRR